MDFTATEREQLDHLNGLIKTAWDTQKSFQNDFSLTGRHWFFQFRDEIARLLTEKNQLLDEARLRYTREHLETLL